MLRPSSVISIFAAAITLAAPAGAQDAPLPPVVTVTPFTGTRDARQARALADSLATTLVDSRRCRVLPIEWLPVVASGGPRSMQEARNAAETAGVQYVVAGDIRVVARPTGFGRTMRLRGVRPIAPPSRGAEQLVEITLRVVDVRSGAVVRTAIGETPDAASRRSPWIAIAAAVLLTRSPSLGLLATPGLRKPSLAQAADRALAEAAQLLIIPPSPDGIR